MRRLLLAALVALVLPVSAQASHPSAFTQTGLIAVGNPGTRTIGGATEVVSPCLGSIDQDVPAGAAQGTDGYWFEIPEAVRGHAATLVAAAPNDVDAWFYDENCTLIKPSGTGPVDPDAYSMASLSPEPDGNESGKIPAAAAWAVVDLYVGAAATFTFNVPA